MTKYLVLILALLIPSTASAGQAAKRMMMVMGKRPITITANSINGITALSSSGTTDTGTGTGSGSGEISIPVYCDGTGGSADVFLIVNGAQMDSISCTGVIQSASLTATVSGNYTARIYGAVDMGYFTAGGEATPFSFPIAP